jgi:hypothetical protein
LERAYSDVSRLAKFMDPLGTLVPDLTRDLSDSVLYERRYEDAVNQSSRLSEQLDDLDKQIKDKLALEGKCGGKGKKSSELNMRQDPRVYALGEPAFLRVAVSGASSSGSARTPCGGSSENLMRCEGAQQAMRDIRNYDFPQTKFAVGEVLRVLGPFGEGDAGKISDEEVLRRAKDAAGALNRLAVPLDHMVSNSNKVLTLLQGGGT